MPEPIPLNSVDELQARIDSLFKKFIIMNDNGLEIVEAPVRLHCSHCNFDTNGILKVFNCAF